jgi:hypothetical protein
MKRNPAILISLIVLLLIGGGGVAFYSHLRKHAPPRYSEVDAFLEDTPVSDGWERTRESYLESGCMVRVSWIQSLNPLSRGTPISQRAYSFKRGEFKRARLVITYTEGSKRIDEIIIKGDPAGAGDFNRLLLEKFPRLRRVLHVNP